MVYENSNNTLAQHNQQFAAIHGSPLIGRRMCMTAKD
jgi:hypothetical protein